MKYILIITLLLATSCSTTEKQENQENADMTSAFPESNKIAEVNVMTLHPSVFSHEIVSNGRAYAREKVDVAFSNTGIIETVCVRNGQRVAKGQLLVTLNTDKLVNQLEKDRNAVATASLEMQDVLISRGYDPEQADNIPEDVIELARLKSGLRNAELQVAATQRELDQAYLKSPVNGVVANLSTGVHNLATTSKPLCTIIDDSGMYVEFTVLESELPMVRCGGEVAIAPFSTTESRQGEITEINPMVDENGMVKVRARVDGGKGLIDGMNVRVCIRQAVAESLVVPKSAVIMRQGRKVIFTLDGDKARWNYVTTGLENLSEYTITDGLAPGMTVIVTGNMNLAHEAPVRVIE